MSILTFLSRHVSTTEADDVLARMQRRLPQLLSGADRHTRVDQLSLDSLDLVELLCATEDEFGVVLTHDAFGRARTVGDLTHLIAKRARRAQRTVHDLR